MSLSVKERPQGLKILSGQYSGVITDSSGDALVTLSAHGLVDGDFVFVDSEVTEYNGLWEIDSISSSTFKLRKDGGYVEFFVNAPAPYFKTSLHAWSATFLPIVYKIFNDRWPVNTYDAVLTLSSILDDNGYTRVQFAGTIHDAGIRRFEYVKIVGSNFDGTYQVVEVITPNDLVLSLSFDAAYLGGTIQYYYNNYQAIINVYGGLPAGHPWEPRKPMELLAVLAIKPDENNISMFSISDVIKTKLAIKNDLGLYSLPLNLDAFTGFQIEYAESFEQSDAYSTFQEQLTETLDSFVGYASASQLPFKNIYGGMMSAYVKAGTPAEWLTLMTDMLAVAGYYFDLSFIKNIVGAFTVIIQKYVSGYLTATEEVEYEDQGVGVYRIPFTVDSQYDRYCVTVQSTSDVPDLAPLDEWETEGGDLADLDEWTGWNFLGGIQQIVVNGNDGVSPDLEAAFIGFENVSYDFSIQADNPSSGVNGLTSDWTYSLLDSIGNVLDSVTIAKNSFGPVLHNFTLTPVGGTPVTFRLVCINHTAIESKNFYVEAATLLEGVAWTVGANPTVTLETGEVSADIKGAFSFIGGTNYLVTIDFDVTEASTLTVKLRNGVTVVTSGSDSYAAGNHVAQFALSPGSSGDLMAVQVDNDFGSENIIDINSVIVESGDAEGALTETICFDIVAPCDIAGFVPDDNIRLTEDGDFRILE